MSDKKKHNFFDKPVKRRTFIKYGAAAATGVILSPLSPLIKISPVGATGEVRIGWITGMTGFAGPWARTFNQVFTQAVDEFNEAGGFKSLGGAKLKIVLADSKTDLKLQASLTEKMINVDKIDIIMGAAGSALEMVTSAICNKYGAINVGGSTSDGLTERGLEYYFRVACKASANGKCAAQFAWHMYHDIGKKFKNVGVIHSDDAWGTSAGKTVEAEIKKHPEWNNKGRIAYPPAKMVDATDYIARAKGQGIEVLFQSSTPESGIIIQQAVKSSNYNPQANVHAHGAPYKKEYVDALGKDAEYVFCATQFVSDMLKKYPKNVVDFCGRYEKRYKGEEVDDNGGVAGMLLATMIDAIERAGSTDPDKIREALLETDMWVGAWPWLIAGQGVKFDETHHNARAITNMHQMHDGKLRCVWPEKFRTTQWVWPVPEWKDRA